MELSKELKELIKSEAASMHPDSKYEQGQAVLLMKLGAVLALESTGWISGDKTVEMLRCGRCGKPPKEDRKEGEQCLQFSNGEDWGMFCAGTIIKSTVPLPPKP